MYIEIDLESVPPTISLQEATDFTSFKVVATRPEHAHVSVAALRDLAGEERASDAAWAVNFDKMLAYAQSKGWVREDGAIRAHVEWKAS